MRRRREWESTALYTVLRLLTHPWSFFYVHMIFAVGSVAGQYQSRLSQSLSKPVGTPYLASSIPKVYISGICVYYSMTAILCKHWPHPIQHSSTCLYPFFLSRKIWFKCLILIQINKAGSVTLQSCKVRELNRSVSDLSLNQIHILK